MASYSVNRIQVVGPWPCLARLSRLHAERGGALGPGFDPHPARWESDPTLGLGLALRGESRHAPPLASCLALSAEFPDCVFLLSHLDERSEREGKWILLSGEAVWSSQDCPETLAAALDVMEADPALSREGARRLLEEQAPALGARARGMEPLSAVFLSRERSDRLLEPLFKALSDGPDPAKELAAALQEEPSLRGISLLEARALFEAPPAGESEPTAPAERWAAARFASAGPLLTPRGPRPGGAFALFAEAACLPDDVAFRPRAQFLNQVAEFLLSSAPEQERLELCERYLRAPSGRRLLSAFPAERILDALTILTTPPPGVAELADLLLSSGLMASERLLELAQERLAEPAAGLSQQRGLARMAEAMERPDRLALSRSPALAHRGILRSALERMELGEGVVESLAPNPPPGFRL